MIIAYLYSTRKVVVETKMVGNRVTVALGALEAQVPALSEECRTWLAGIRMGVIKLKRIYDSPDKEDGFRILVDRLWPRGLTKADSRIDLWMKEIAPSNQLREWFHHDETRWAEFKQKYFEELEQKRDLLGFIASKSEEGPVTLLFGAKSSKFNNGVALKEYLETVYNKSSGMKTT